MQIIDGHNNFIPTISKRSVPEGVAYGDDRHEGNPVALPGD